MNCQIVNLASLVVSIFESTQLNISCTASSPSSPWYNLHGLFFMSCMVSHCDSGMDGGLVGRLTTGGATCSASILAGCALSDISTSVGGSSCRVRQKRPAASCCLGSWSVDDPALLI